MRPKSVLAIGIGIVALGYGAWRVYVGEHAGGAVVCAVGLFLVFRGLTGTVRRGL
jgi:hypothetical protein